MKKMIGLLAEYGVGLLAGMAVILLGIGAALIFVPSLVFIALRWLLAGLCILAGLWLLASLILYAIDARRRRKENDSCAV